MISDRTRKFTVILLSGLIAALMYVLLLRQCGIVPFGEGTWSMFDLKRQYMDFYAWYQRVFRGQEGILYSFQTTLGSGMTGFFMYYLTNPLLLLLLPFRTDRLPLAVSFVIGVTIVLAAVIMAAFLWWYLEKRAAASRPLIRAAAVITGAMAWSFSGFLIAHSMNPMWTDVVILVPLVIYALERAFLEGAGLWGRRLRYTLVIALILLLNYYIAYQVLIFVVIWFAVRLWETRGKHLGRTILAFVGHTAAAAGLDAVLLVPTFLELLNSPKDIFQLGLEAKGKNLTPLDVFSKAFYLAYDGHQPISGLPQIYAGILMLALVLLFFLNRRRSIRERIASLIPLIVLLTAFCLDPVNLVWHAMMEPSGHPYRQAPLFIFVCVLCGCRALAGLGGEQEKKIGLLWLALRYAVGLVIAEAVLFFVGKGSYEYSTAVMLTQNAWHLAVCFAGLFGADLLLRLKAGGGGSGRIRQTVSAVLVAGLVLMMGEEMIDNAAFTYGFLSLQADTRNGFMAEVDSVQPVVDAVEAMDDGFYRMENLSPRQQNDGMMYGYRGITHYSSAGKIYVRYLLHRMGFNDDGLLTHYGHNGTVTMDMLLGIRYVLTRDGRLVHDAYERVLSAPETGVMVYRNPYALPVAVAVDDYDLSGIAGIEDPTGIDADPFALQEDMLSRMLGSRAQVFVPAETENAGEEDPRTLDVLVTPEISGEVYMYLDGLMGTVQGLTVFLEDEALSTYGNAACYSILDLGYHESGETLHVRVEGDSEAPDFGRPLFMTEDMAAVDAVFQEISSRGLEVRQDGTNGIRLQVPEGCGGIVTSIPYEAGWNVPAEQIYGALMFIPAESVNRYAADGCLRLWFMPQGIAAGGVVSALTLMLLGVWLWRGLSGEKRRAAAGREEKTDERGAG